MTSEKNKADDTFEIPKPTEGMVPVGGGCYLAADAILGVFKPESSPVRRAYNQYAEVGKAFDLTYGGRRRCVILAGGCLFSSIRQPKTIADKVSTRKVHMIAGFDDET